ncbi:PHP domain-containing protein [Nocardia barduliensis]|nr:PHP domain-containing protein [Nocardia barduliensis]
MTNSNQDYETMIPSDSHVHSQWSWDALNGSMEGACARAAEIGLPAVAFTEHADFTTWSIPAAGIATMPERFQQMVQSDGLFHPPRLDVSGYLECLDKCRIRFPELRIRSGVEVGEPHWHPAQVDELLGAGDFDCVIGSVHSIRKGGVALVVDRAFAGYDADDVMHSYLSEVLDLIRSPARFTVLGHLDYPLREWPESAGELTTARFEDEFRTVLAELAESGRALEFNTRLLPPIVLLEWWRDAGGTSLSFGSDAHDAARLGAGFTTAAAVARNAGFHPATDDLWMCRTPSGRAAIQ